MPNPNYQHLAKEFMDLWQKQISAVISDKQFIQSMLDMLQAKNSTGTHEQPNATSASHATDASDVDAGVLAKLAIRVAMCEKRLSTLEQSAAKPSTKRRSVKSSPGTSSRKGSKKSRG